MTSPGGLLEFFILEASEYVEQLDGLLARGGASGPDADAIYRQARALRGSATMAKLPAIAELAAAMERVGRALRENALRWEPGLGGAVTSAIDDLKLLVRAVREWSPAEDQRAATRSAELARFAPVRFGVPSTPSASSGSTFFSAEASNIAAGLDLLAARPEDRDGAANVLRRVRALRGIAGIREIGPLADVMEAAELVMKPLELGDGPIDARGQEVLRSGALLLRVISGRLRAGAPVDPPSPELDSFRAAVERYQGAEAPSERIVPISQLFFEDAGPKVVSTAPNPPTSPAERFRLEMVSQGEHLQGLVAEARIARDPGAQDRVRRELRHALDSLRAAAESFGEADVAELIAGHGDAVESLDYLGLEALDALASVLTKPGSQGERLGARLAELRGGRTLDTGIGSALVGTEPGPAKHPTEPRLSAVLRAQPAEAGAAIPAPVAVPAPPAAPSPPPPASAPVPARGPAVGMPTPSSAPTPIVNPAVPAPRPSRPYIQTPVASAMAIEDAGASAAAPAPTPVPAAPAAPQASPAPAPQRSSTPAPHRRSGEGLIHAIDDSITGIRGLTQRPLSPPRPLELPIVPVDDLVYRGRAAIERAIALREEVRRSGGTPERAVLEELFDLLDLALAE